MSLLDKIDAGFLSLPDSWACGIIFMKTVHAAAVADDVHPYLRVYAQWVVREGLLSS
jgi:hypothetical protein